MVQPYLINDIKVGNTASVEIEFIPSEGETAVKAIELTLMDSERVNHSCLWEKLADNRFRGYYEIPITGPAGVWVYRWDTLIGPEAAGELKFNVVGSSFYSSSGDTTLINHGTLIGLGDDDHPQYLLKTDNIFINAKDYGAVGDGVTDDTAALQAWATYVALNQKQGFLPNGNYKITSAIVFPVTNGGSWTITGEASSRQFLASDPWHYATVIRQHTNNTPIFKIGTDADGAGPFNTHVDNINIRNISFYTSSQQPSSATNSIGIAFNVCAYYSSFEQLHFESLGWGMKTLGPVGGPWTQQAPWGNYFNNISCRRMAIGMFWFEDDFAGSPNNLFGRMTLFCDDAIGPMIYLQPNNNHFNVLEFLNVTGNNPQLMLLKASCDMTIDSVKCEFMTYTEALNGMFRFPGNCSIDIGYMFIGGVPGVIDPASGDFYIVSAGTGNAPIGWQVKIGTLEVAPVGMTIKATNVYAVQGVIPYLLSDGVTPGVSSGGFDIGHLQFYNGNMQLCNNNTTLTPNNTIVRAWQNNRVSDNRGDANYTVTRGDPNIAHFTTPFTAQRTITLPAKESGNNFNGLSYTLVFNNGAINGANTALIKEGVVTLRTQTVDKVAITYTWRRGIVPPTLGEWVMTSYQTLP